MDSHKERKNKNKLKKLKILSINVNSIITNQRRASLLNIMKSQQPDILLINETKLNKQHVLRFEKYNIIRNDRNNTQFGGGTAIIIKKGIKYTSISLPENNENKILEHTIIKLDSSNGKAIYIIAVYAKSGYHKEFIPQINRLFKFLKLNLMDNYYIIAGDLNAKHIDWKNPNNNARGESFKRWIDTHNIEYKLRLLSTRYPSYPNGNSYLDIVLLDTRLKVHDTENDHDLENIIYDSDHNALKIHISLEKEHDIIKDNEIRVKKYNYGKANWEKFTKKLEESITNNVPNNKNLSIVEVEKYLDQCNQKIISTMEEIIPKIKDKNTMETYINNKIKKLQKQKNKLLTQIHHNRRNWPNVNITRDGNLRSELNKIKEKLKIEFTLSINKYWKNKITNITKKDSTNMFPQINKIFRKKEMAQIDSLILDQNSTLLIDAGINKNELKSDEENTVTIINDIDKLNVMGAHFANINNRTMDNKKPTLNNIIQKEIKNLKGEMEQDSNNKVTICNFNNINKSDNPIQELYFTNIRKMTEKFRKLNNKKSTGLDDIPNIVLKHIPRKLIIIYTILFNNLLNNNAFPDKWKLAKVVTIKKKNKDKRKPDSYRPISLLPNISKVYECIINDQIIKFCIENDIIPESQFGFQKNLSTIHAINRLTSDINWNLNKKNCIGACLIDLEKAFDTVWLEGLIYKLIKHEFPKNLIKLIWNMIKNKKLIISSGDLLANKTYELTNGLQQGTVNSPILFNIYTSNMLKLFNLNTPGHPQIIAFADDVIVYVADRWISNIQKKLNDIIYKLQEYYETWRLKININKCETILFRSTLTYANRNVRNNYKKFKIVSKSSNGESQTIPHKNMVKYLGIHLDERMLFKNHAIIQLKKATVTFMGLKRLFYSKLLNTEVKIICYTSLIRPIITYGCPIWFNISASLMEKFRLFERKCIRACLNLNKTAESDYTKYVSNNKLYNEAKIQRIDNFIIYLIREHFLQVGNIKQNSLVHCALYPNPLYYDNALANGNIPPEGFIYLDQMGYIQDENDIPIIYHFPRHNSNKQLKYPPFTNAQDINIKWRYETSIPTTFKNKRHKSKIKYWWLTNDNK